MYGMMNEAERMAWHRDMRRSQETIEKLEALHATLEALRELYRGEHLGHITDLKGVIEWGMAEGLVMPEEVGMH